MEALALAVVSIIRPTTAAAVWAMLVSSQPRRLLAVYLLADMAGLARWTNLVTLHPPYDLLSHPAVLTLIVMSRVGTLGEHASGVLNLLLGISLLAMTLGTMLTAFANAMGAFMQNGWSL